MFHVIMINRDKTVIRVIIVIRVIRVIIVIRMIIVIGVINRIHKNSS